MSVADELLNSLDEYGISMMSAGSTSDPHIVVNDDKTITVPESLQHIAVQYDHNVKTVTFDCPRYWDHRDLHTMHIYINVTRPDGTKEPFQVENVSIDAVDNHIIHFDWTITNRVTYAKGPLSFLVCAKKSLDDGTEVNHWNSRLNHDLVIDEGMECSESVVESNPDIIEAILMRLDALESPTEIGSVSATIKDGAIVVTSKSGINASVNDNVLVVK